MAFQDTKLMYSPLFYKLLPQHLFPLFLTLHFQKDIYCAIRSEIKNGKFTRFLTGEIFSTICLCSVLSFNERKSTKRSLCRFLNFYLKDLTYFLFESFKSVVDRKRKLVSFRSFIFVEFRIKKTWCPFP